MKSLLLLSMMFSCFINQEKEPNNSVWKHIDPIKKDSYQILIAEKALMTIPFFWQTARIDSLENLIINWGKTDSMKKANVNPIFYLTPIYKMKDFQIFYSGKAITFEKDNCHYIVYRFIANWGTEVNLDDCYFLYYIKDVGLITVAHATVEDPKWDKYVLVDLRDKDDQSLVNTTALAEISKELIGGH